MDFKKQNRIKVICPRKESVNSDIHLSFILLTDTRKERVIRAVYKLTKSKACITVGQKASQKNISVHIVSLVFHHHSNVLMLKECASHSLLSTSFYFPKTHLSLRGFMASSLYFWKVLSYLATMTPSRSRRFRLRHHSCSQSSDWHCAEWPQRWSDQLLGQPDSCTLT